MMTRKQIHIKNFDYSGSSHIYYLTLCAYNGKTLFQHEGVAKVVIDELDFRRRVSQEIKLYCFCLMPDHLHLLMSLSENYQKSLQNWVAAFKRYNARVANLLYEVSPLWQKNFYEHVVRTDESLLRITAYIVNNPVRKGFVSKWQDYPYSGMVDSFPV
jgi:putative transposase